MTPKMVRTTLVCPSDVWAKVYGEKFRRGDDSLNDVVVRALRVYFVLREYPHGLDSELAEMDPTLCEGIKAALMGDKDGKKYECELCGDSIPKGKEKRLEDGDTVVCAKCFFKLDPAKEEG